MFRYPSPNTDPRLATPRWLKITAATILVSILLTLITLFYIYFFLPKQKIETLHARYAAITKPATATQVLQFMSDPPTYDDPVSQWIGSRAFWDDDIPPNYEEESKKIRRVIRYSVTIFPFGVTFEFTFDADNNLIGKHRYD